MATKQRYEMTAKWNGADVLVSLQSRSRPTVRADKLADLLGAPVQLWLLRNDVKCLVHETSNYRDPDEHAERVANSGGIAHLMD